MILIPIRDIRLWRRKLSFWRPRSGFYDLRWQPGLLRVPRSHIIQFYSSTNNIGNYLPVLGIQKMLGISTDTWCIHDHNIDFDFINRHYRCGIIGGAGLLHGSFESFWRRLSRECRIPLIVWGVGGCFANPDAPKPAKAPVSRDPVVSVLRRCDLINFRDDYTAEYYGCTAAHISACPTVEYLDGWTPIGGRSDGHVLLTDHSSLISQETAGRLRNAIGRAGFECRSTQNAQRFNYGLKRIIRDDYQPSSIVVTSRLHGAIIAYGLEIPYIAVARDAKLREFHRLFGNGTLLEAAEDLPDQLSEARSMPLGPRALQDVRAFGNRAKSWVTIHIKNTPGPATAG